MSKPDWVSDLVHDERRRVSFEGGYSATGYEKEAEILRLRHENYRLKEIISYHNIDIETSVVPPLVNPGSNYSLCVWLVDLHGSSIWSYTNQKDTEGKPVKYTSDFSTGNKHVYVHKDDLADARAASLWKVIT